MTTTPHVLATGPLVQAWSNAAAITTNDDWSGVPSIVGYLGQDITTVTGADPQTLTADSSLPNDLDVIANQTNPNTLNAGGVAEFALPDPTIALQGSGTADAPNLVLYLDATGRRDVAVTFHETATGEDFTAVINHLKSKGGAGNGADADQADGQGGWQQQRELAAAALTKWLALKPTGTTDSDVVLLGDFNAYIKEDALDVLKAGGFTNLAEDRLANPYSYVFDRGYGALDHALANASLNRQVTGVTEWHINADETDAIDYNLDFGRSAAYFDGLVPARESDHDPILLGLTLDQTAPRLVSASPAGNALKVAVGANIVLTFSEAVKAGTGAITITDGGGDTRNIPVGDTAQVSISGATVTIHPAAALKAGTA